MPATRHMARVRLSTSSAAGVSLRLIKVNSLGPVFRKMKPTGATQVPPIESFPIMLFTHCMLALLGWYFSTSSCGTSLRNLLRSSMKSMSSAKRWGGSCSSHS